MNEVEGTAGVGAAHGSPLSEVLPRCPMALIKRTCDPVVLRMGSRTPTCILLALCSEPGLETFREP